MCCGGDPTFTGYPLSSNPESCPQPPAFSLSSSLSLPSLSEMPAGVGTVLYCVLCVILSCHIDLSVS